MTGPDAGRGRQTSDPGPHHVVTAAPGFEARPATSQPTSTLRQRAVHQLAAVTLDPGNTVLLAAAMITLVVGR